MKHYREKKPIASKPDWEDPTDGSHRSDRNESDGSPRNKVKKLPKTIFNESK